MLKFKGFKATLNLFGKNKQKSRHEEHYFEVSTTGVYRTSINEFYENGTLSNPPKKLTPSMVQLPKSTQPRPSGLSSSKSAGNLQSPNINLPAHLHKSTPEISFDPRGGPSNNKDTTQTNQKVKPTKESKNQEKERKKLEKQQLAEQKKREKLATQEQARIEKLRKENERQREQPPKPPKRRKDKERVANNKVTAPQPPPLPQSEPSRSNPLAQAPVRYSTNTLESSISRSSGPPPYSELPRPSVVPNQKDGSGNTSFSKSIDSSWDLVSQHRQQINRPKIIDSKSRELVMDLQYNAGNAPSISNQERDSAA